MESVEPESEPIVSSAPARALRGLALVCVSLVAIAIAGIVYLHPTATWSTPQAPRVVSETPGYRVSALDFVDLVTGWIVVDFDSGDYALIHTADGGLSWTRQFAGAGQGHRHYLKFFDTAVGVIGLVGTAPDLHRTSDGGRTWTTIAMPSVRGTVVSWSFVDSFFGWALVSGTSADSPSTAYLYRTEDGGFTWVNLGTPAPAPDEAFEVSFSYFTTGWLSSASSRPYAYKTGDYGETWTRVPLPAPRGGWPSGGTFMVAVQPTSGTGVVASVVFFPTLKGRKGQGATIQDFPPLTVRTFDGGVPVTYTYATAIGSRNLGPIPQAQAPNQTRLGTLDNGASWTPITVPSSSGALGYSDAADWWWVGSGQWAHSQDGGATWAIPVPIDALDPVPGTLDVLDTRHGYFADVQGTRPVLEFTDEFGLHWRAIPLPGLAGADQALT
ncbi:MAG TPA: hypothetical protein VLK30_03535 [Candidatus Limnocylindrales bacterium]|nr:hypothetical protein [Candidatus Limnocylindrales bacterium]